MFRATSCLRLNQDHARPLVNHEVWKTVLDLMLVGVDALARRSHSVWRLLCEARSLQIDSATWIFNSMICIYLFHKSQELCKYDIVPLERTPTLHYIRNFFVPQYLSRRALELQGPTFESQSLTKDIQARQDTRSKRHNDGLNAKREPVPTRRAPRLLKIAHGEPTRDAREVDKRRHLARTRRVAVKRVGRNGNRGNHDPKDIHAPSHDDSGVVEVLLQGLPDDDEARNHEEGGDVVCGQAGFGAEDAGVGADVAVGHEVVEEVAEDLAERDGDDGGQVDEADGFGAEAVAAGHLRRFEQDGRGDVDAHGPHEAQCAAGEEILVWVRARIERR